MMRSKTPMIAVTALLAIILIIAAVFIMRGRGAAPAADQADSCTKQTLAVGASGHCVSDVQALVNLMQSNKLIEACPYEGGAPLEASGTFDAATQQQVKVVQNWVNCYNKEEGLSDRLNVEGTVDSATWTSLCTYGYTFPKRSNQSTSYLQPGLAAGADAGCR